MNRIFQQNGALSKRSSSKRNLYRKPYQLIRLRREILNWSKSSKICAISWCGVAGSDGYWKRYIWLVLSWCCWWGHRKIFWQCEIASNSYSARIWKCLNNCSAKKTKWKGKLRWKDKSEWPSWKNWNQSLKAQTTSRCKNYWIKLGGLQDRIKLTWANLENLCKTL